MAKQYNGARTRIHEYTGDSIVTASTYISKNNLYYFPGYMVHHSLSRSSQFFKLSEMLILDLQLLVNELVDHQTEMPE